MVVESLWAPEVRLLMCDIVPPVMPSNESHGFDSLRLDWEMLFEMPLRVGRWEECVLTVDGNVGTGPDVRVVRCVIELWR